MDTPVELWVGPSAQAEDMRVTLIASSRGNAVPYSNFTSRSYAFRSQAPIQLLSAQDSYSVSENASISSCAQQQVTLKLAALR